MVTAPFQTRTGCATSCVLLATPIILLTTHSPYPDPIPGIMIFLANNEIKALPPEFFKLSSLTVLSLCAHLPLFVPFRHIY